MESVRDSNVDPPDRRRVWEAPSNTRSNPMVGKQITSIGWLVSNNRFR